MERFQREPPCRSPREARTLREERSCRTPPWKCLQNVFPRGPLLGSSASLPSPRSFARFSGSCLGISWDKFDSQFPGRGGCDSPARVGTNVSSQLCLSPARAAEQRLGGLFRLALSAGWLMSHLFASGYSALCRYVRGCFLPRVSPYPMGCKAAAETVVSCSHCGDSSSIHCSNRCLKGTLAVLLKAYSALPYLSFPRSDHPCVCFVPTLMPQGQR